MTDLSENEYVFKQLLPATSREITDTMEISASYVYDLVESLRNKGYQVNQDAEGRYYVGDVPELGNPNNTEARRKTSGEKSAESRKANKFLAELEHQLKTKLSNMDDGPPVADEDNLQRDGAQDLIIHATDDHFGEYVTNQYGDVLYETPMAQDRAAKRFKHAISEKQRREDAGTSFDGVNLLVGGDIITNDDLFDGQGHEIDCPMGEQINKASEVYLEGIRKLSDEFPRVTVACTPGNHGRLSYGSPSNADSILYSMIELAIRESDMSNVTFLKSDRNKYINFEIRDWRAHLRHGHGKSLEHIGTSAGKQRWLTWLADHQFDVAFRGHYHSYKEEPVAGRSVHMGGTLVPQTAYEEANALSGRPVSAIHGATNVAPTEWTEKLYFE